jgi:hypothetical protein
VSHRASACAAVVLVLATPLTLRAGGRARAGGTLELAAIVQTSPTDSLLADTPLEATLLGLTRLPPCRLGELSRPTPRRVRLTVRPSAEPGQIAFVLSRARAPGSPYRSLLAAVKNVTTTASTVELELDGPAPDLEAVLCHPVLASSTAFFAAQGDHLVTNADPAQPRAWLDGVTVRATDARTAERLLAQRKV